VDLEITISDDEEAARLHAFHGAEIRISDARYQQNLDGDPATVVAIAGSVSAIAAMLNHIAHSWKKDVIVDVRKKACRVEKSSSRGGRLIVVKPSGVDVYDVKTTTDASVQRAVSRALDR